MVQFGVSVTGDQIMARRQARDLVDDLRWLGVAVPPIYTRMAREFLLLVQSGEYEEWIRRGGPAGRM